MASDFSKCSLSNLWGAIKNYNLGYLMFLVEEWYIDNIRWRIKHYILSQRCENCRNWHFQGVIRFEDHPNERRKYGECDFDTLYWQDYHGWCPVWNIDFDIEERGYTLCDDGWERGYTTPAGKKIIQVSKNGIWMYKCDNKEEEE